MHFPAIALLAAASTVVMAAPVFDDIEARNGKTLCCPKGKLSKCTVEAICPNGNDIYANCTNISQVGLVDLFLCDVLNNVNVIVPITVSVPILS